MGFSSGQGESDYMPKGYPKKATRSDIVCLEYKRAFSLAIRIYLENMGDHYQNIGQEHPEKWSIVAQIAISIYEKGDY